MTTFRIVPAVAIVVAATLLHFVPLWRREQLWFGVTVPAGFDKTPEARRVLRGYRTIVWAAAVLALVLAAGAANARSAEVGLPFVAVGAFVAFARGHRRTEPFAAEPSGVRSAPLDETPEGLPGGWIAAIGPFVLLGATAWYLRMRWAGLGDRIPMHWNLSGEADRWASRTPAHVFGPLLIAGAMALMMLGLGVMILRRSPRARMGEAAAWTTRFRRANLLLLVVAVWCVSGLMSVLTLAPLLAGNTMRSPFAWIAPAVMLLVLAPFVWRLVRITREPASGADNTPDACWYGGMIYFNPHDPAVMLEKRFGVGYTINLGSPMAWVCFAVLVACVCLARWVQ